MKIHDRALESAKAYTSASQSLIKVLIEVDTKRAFEDHKFTHLTPYCEKFIKLDPDVAKTLVRIVRKSIHVPELAHAVIEGTIHVSNAKVIASVITPENKDEWIKKASQLPKAKLEREVAANGGPDKKRVSLNLPLEVLELLKRAQEILASKRNQIVSQEQTIEEVLREFVQRHDPVEKAKRSRAKEGMTAAKHAANERDQARCVFLYDDGSQCDERKWLQLHHVIHKAQGGEDTAENLVCLCAAHHRMHHVRHRRSRSPDCNFFWESQLGLSIRRYEVQTRENWHA